MPIEYQCSGCGRRLRAKEMAVGKELRCRTCGSTTQVPDLSAELEATQTYVPADDEFPDFNDVVRRKSRSASGKKRRGRKSQSSSMPRKTILVYGTTGGITVAAIVAAVILLSPAKRVPSGNSLSTKTDSDSVTTGRELAKVSSNPMPSKSETLPVLLNKTENDDPSKTDHPLKTGNEDVVPKQTEESKPEKRPVIQSGSLLPIRFHNIYRYGESTVMHGGRMSVPREVKAMVMAWSVDGRFLAIQTDPNKLEIVDIVNWKSIGNIGSRMRSAALLHRDSIFDAAFSPDGKTLATASGRILPGRKRPAPGERVGLGGGTPNQRGQLRLWNVTTGTEIGEPMEFEHRVRRVVFSPDGKRLIFTAADIIPRNQPRKRRKTFWDLPESKSIHVLDRVTLKEVDKPLPFLGEIHTLQFSADGKLMLTAGAFHRDLKLWNIETGKRVKRLRVSVSGILCSAISRDGKLVVASTADGQVHAWNTAITKQIAVKPVLIGYAPKESNSLPVVKLAISPDGALLATVTSTDQYIRLWSLPTLKPIGQPLEHTTKGMSAIQFSPDGRFLLSGGSDGIAQLWSVATMTKVGPPMKHEQPIIAANISPDGRWIVTVAADGARIWFGPQYSENR